MKYFIQLSVLISVVLALSIGCYINGSGLIAGWALQKDMGTQLVNLQSTLKSIRINAKKANQRLKEENTEQQKVFLRDALFDFNLMLEQLPSEVVLSDIDYGKPITGDINEAAEFNEESIPFVNLSLKLAYRDYLIAVAVFLEWFAYSSLPIVVEEFSIERGHMEINIKLYGLLE